MADQSLTFIKINQAISSQSKTFYT